jgi:hypothetical protein
LIKSYADTRLDINQYTEFLPLKSAFQKSSSSFFCLAFVIGFNLFALLPGFVPLLYRLGGGNYLTGCGNLCIFCYFNSIF